MKLAPIFSALTAMAALSAVLPGKTPPMLSFGKLREISHRDWAVRPEEQPLPAPSDLPEGVVYQQ